MQDESSSWAEPAKPAAPRMKRRGGLLLVDDEFLVRVGTRAMLADLGYSVTEAESAQKALDLIEDGYQPDIVVTDHLMPGMTGADLALQLRANHPGIAVIIISGYQGIDLIAPDIVRLTKPFRQAHLETSLEAARAQVARTPNSGRCSSLASARSAPRRFLAVARSP